MEKVGIVIPAHNEGKRINNILTAYLAYFSGLKKEGILDFEIVVVLNACSDNTLDVVEEFKYRELFVLNLEQGGKGLAITEGFKSLLKRDVDLIGFVDADGATPPEAFYDLIRRINGYDGVIADRWHRKSIVAKQTVFRRFISRGYNFIVRSLFLLPYRDTQCGAKIFRREVLERNIHKIVSSQWNFDVAILFCLRKESNAKIKAIPTTWIDKDSSKVNIRKTPITMFASSIRLRLIHSPFKFLIRLYRKLPSKAKFH